ncbi:MAG: chondroitinase family polysaccharide lyase [Akkermansiaceae bacterium]|jgi:chondroitin-sulfate-ABC endolyase/exolyase
MTPSFTTLLTLSSICFAISACKDKPATQATTTSPNGRTTAFKASDSKHPSQIVFSGDSLPDGMSWKNSTISLDSKRYIWSDNSLRWDWKKDSSITFNRPIKMMGSWDARRKFGFSQPVENCFVVWIYNKTPRPNASLRFSFGKGKDEACHFPFKLNFTGWRTAWVSYNRDMQGKAKAEMDFVKIEAPKNIDAGTLWIGDIIAHQFIDHRHQHGDFQVPFVHGADKLTHGHWDPIMHWYNLGKKPVSPITLTDGHHAAFAKLRRLTTGTTQRLLRTDTVKGLEQQFAKYHISKDANGIYGDHIAMHNQLSGAPDHSIRRKFHSLKDYTGFMKNVGQIYSALPPSDKETAGGKRIAEIFCLLTEHMLDQGFEAGSSLGTMHHFGYNVRWWVPAIASMQEPLEQAGLLTRAREALAWYFNSNQMHAPVDDWANMDYLNTLSQSDFTIQSLGKDDAFKAARLRQYSDWISATLSSPSPGTKGGFKPDGTLFHHNMHYHGYGIPAINVITSRVVGPLDGTPFEITPAAYAQLKNAFMAARFWCYPYSGFNACGRHPITGGVGGIKGPMRVLARSKPGTNVVDTELAAAYLRMFGGNSTKLFGKEIAAENLNGFLAMNYASSGTHANGNSTAHIKGYGAGIRSHETYKGANRYGRNLSHGTIQIFKNTTDHRSGNEVNGWDWCRLPGATTLRVPLDTLEGSTGFYGTTPKQKTYPSGTGSLGGKYGAFLFQLDPTKDAQSLRVRKSVFAIDNTLICLGSGISNASTEYPTVTTLFQTSTPEKGDLSAKGKNWFIDPFGTGYFLPTSQSVKHELGKQESRHSHTKKETTGLFSTAWIDHGIAPKNASYQYRILLDAKPEEMEAYTVDTIKVLQQNDNAHIIAYPSKQLEAVVTFAEFESTTNSILRSTDRSCIVLTRKTSDNFLNVSVTDIDLADVGAKPMAGPVTITLQGTWVLRDKTDIIVSHENEQTTLMIPTHRGMPREFELVPS